MEHYPNFLPKKYLSRNHYGRTHLEINIEGTYQNDDCGNGFHQVGNGFLIGTDFLRGLGKPAAPLLAAMTSPTERTRAVTANILLCANVEAMKRSAARCNLFFNCCIF